MRKKQNIDFGPPEPTDGMALNRLVAKSPPLDTNSVYCNLLQCSHFKETSVCAKLNDAVVGFISGYIIPERPNTVFVWQVVVDESVRGNGVGLQMLNELLDRLLRKGVDSIETTITATNEASQALFRKFADRRSAPVIIRSGFDKETHFYGQHDSEKLWHIGPIPKT